MFNEFIKFIKDDPIMLGLSCAIAFLVSLFILVLIFGGKKKSKKIEDNVEDNTAALLKSDLGTEPLKSTQEFTLNINTEMPVQDPIVPFEKDMPNAESTHVEDAIPVPVEIENSAPTEFVAPKINMEDTITLQPQDVSITQTVVLPNMNEEQESVEELPIVKETKEEVKDSLDDIELPMLNKSADTSVLSSLQGEHYNI